MSVAANVLTVSDQLLFAATNKMFHHAALSLIMPGFCKNELYIHEKSRKRTLRKTRDSFFPDAKTQLVSTFFKASKPGM